MTDPADISMLYITAAGKAEAQRIGRALVEERLAACANIIDGMSSIYRWQGQIEEAHEAVLIAKTRTALVERAVARVKELHEYACPCVIAWPIAAGNPDYCQWLIDESES